MQLGPGLCGSSLGRMGGEPWRAGSTTDGPEPEDEQCGELGPSIPQRTPVQGPRAEHTGCRRDGTGGAIPEEGRGRSWGALSTAGRPWAVFSQGVASEMLFLRTPLRSSCCCGSHGELVGFGKEGSGFRSRLEDWLVLAGQDMKGCAGAAPVCAASSARPSGHEEQAECERGRVCWLGSGGWAPPCGHMGSCIGP